MTGPGEDGGHVAHVVWDEALTGYDFGASHPMAPERLDLTVRLARELGLLDAPGVRVVGAPVPGTDELVLTAHDPDYVAAVRAASGPGAGGGWAEQLPWGLGTDDDPAFPGMHEAAGRVVAATVAAAGAVWSGRAAHAVNISGGLHHAMRRRASGFCVYNDVVAGIEHLLAAGAERVAYVDVDVHHGDGVERAFWDDPRVLTVSVHEGPASLFPGTGHPADVGGPGALGTAVNVALPAGTDDRGWLRALHAVVPPVLRAFAPAVLVTQHGCDTHALDPLAHLSLTVDAQRAAAVLLHDLAHEVSGGRWVATGGGGYEVVDVVPRAWAHLIAVAAHRPVEASAPVPAAWLEHVRRVHRRAAPPTMGDRGGRGDPDVAPWAGGVDDGSALDRAVLATRTAVFAHHGLDPWFD